MISESLNDDILSNLLSILENREILRLALTCSELYREFVASHVRSISIDSPNVAQFFAARTLHLRNVSHLDVSTGSNTDLDAMDTLLSKIGPGLTSLRMRILVDSIIPLLKYVDRSALRSLNVVLAPTDGLDALVGQPWSHLQHLSLPLSVSTSEAISKSINTLETLSISLKHHADEMEDFDLVVPSIRLIAETNPKLRRLHFLDVSGGALAVSSWIRGYVFMPDHIAGKTPTGQLCDIVNFTSIRIGIQYDKIVFGPERLSMFEAFWSIRREDPDLTDLDQFFLACHGDDSDALKFEAFESITRLQLKIKASAPLRLWLDRKIAPLLPAILELAHMSRKRILIICYLISAYSFNGEMEKCQVWARVLTTLLRTREDVEHYLLYVASHAPLRSLLKPEPDWLFFCLDDAEWCHRTDVLNLVVPLLMKTGHNYRFSLLRKLFFRSDFSLIDPKIQLDASMWFLASLIRDPKPFVEVLELLVTVIEQFIQRFAVAKYSVPFLSLEPLCSRERPQLSWRVIGLFAQISPTIFPIEKISALCWLANGSFSPMVTLLQNHDEQFPKASVSDWRKEISKAVHNPQELGFFEHDKDDAVVWIPTLENEIGRLVAALAKLNPTFSGIASRAEDGGIKMSPLMWAWTTALPLIQREIEAVLFP